MFRRSFWGASDADDIQQALHILPQIDFLVSFQMQFAKN